GHECHWVAGWDGDPAAGVDPSRHGNVAAPCYVTLALVAAAHRPRVLRHGPQVAQPDRGAPGRCHPDESLADGHFGTDTFGVIAMAGDGVQLMPLLVEQQKQGVLEPEELGQP